MFITAEEFRLLDSCSFSGRIWTLIQRPTYENPYIVKRRTTEYIFDPLGLTMFSIVSRNILVTWDTNITRHLGPGDEIQVKDSIFIRLYVSPFD